MAKTYKTFNINTKLIQLTNFDIIRLHDDILSGLITTYNLKSSATTYNPHENTIVEESKVGHGLKPSEK